MWVIVQMERQIMLKFKGCSTDFLILDTTNKLNFQDLVRPLFAFSNVWYLS